MIVIAGSSNCIYCTKAEDYLDDLGLDYSYELYSKIPEFFEDGHKTIPQIYRKDESGKLSLYIEGGYQGLVDYPVEQLMAEVA